MELYTIYNIHPWNIKVDLDEQRHPHVLDDLDLDGIIEYIKQGRYTKKTVVVTLFIELRCSFFVIF